MSSIKYTKQIIVYGILVQVAIVIPFILFSLIDPLAETLIIINSFWASRIVSYYYRHVKGKCMACGHGNYYHVEYDIRGRIVPSCFHKKGKYTSRDWVKDTLPILSVMNDKIDFCKCSNYTSRDVVMDRISRTRIEP